VQPSIDPNLKGRHVQYVNLGATGLRVSRVCLGMMSFGEDSDRPWVLDEQAAEPIVRAAIEGGITFFDTADTYSAGASEVATGRLLGKLLTREELVVATKVFMPMTPGENGGGLSRKHLLSAIDASLERLQMDYVDLYQIHRWDSRTPIEETIEALHEIVRSGKARYIGASSMFAWQFSKAQHVAELRSWTRFVSMQNHYNLIYREEEREMIPLCIEEGVGVIPWSPLARGVLAGTRTRDGAGADRAGVAAAQAGRHGADRRRDQGAASEGRARRRAAEAQRRGDRAARGALRSAPGPGARLGPAGASPPCPHRRSMS
jgi:aryl-alcohol dehydrogenase-like predicted oxidoreductase